MADRGETKTAAVDEVDEEDVAATLLFDILPYCPKLQIVEMKTNKIK